MADKLKRIAFTLLSVLFWIALWEITAALLDISFILPSVKDTLSALGRLSLSSDFWSSIALSLLRVVIGFSIGCILGILIGVIAALLLPVKYLFDPIMSVIRSTPVASFILLIWFFIGSAKLPSVISLLMVTPLVYQSTVNGLKSVDKDLWEVARVYKFSPLKKVRYLYLPSVSSFLLPVLITSTGLAWKSGIAAEIISYTKNSIGKEIADSKNMFEGADMIAWTITVIILSLLIEYGIKALLKRVKNES